MTPAESGETARIRAAALETLKACYDPEAGLNVVDMGLIVDLSVGDNRLTVTMTRAVRSSPTEEWLVEEVKRRVEHTEGVRGAEVVLVWDPPWTPRRMTEEARAKLGLLARE